MLEFELENIINEHIIVEKYDLSILCDNKGRN
jgi:hypothetical protein